VQAFYFNFNNDSRRLHKNFMRWRLLVAKLITCSLFISTCSVAVPLQGPQHVAWYTDIIGIKEVHLSADFRAWLFQ